MTGKTVSEMCKDIREYADSIERLYLYTCKQVDNFKTYEKALRDIATGTECNPKSRAIQTLEGYNTEYIFKNPGKIESENFVLDDGTTITIRKP